MKIRDPPPSYDGIDPASTFAKFRKDVELWKLDTDWPVTKWGSKMLRGLSGDAREIADVLDVTDIIGDIGLDIIMNAL